ncbi:MAG: hypothetical protein A2X56_10205 [Nitrospirae bacterium GWC2_57_13]|jgi:c(7)-type cytochrome triheme protein|nr:MAG: hypothetical protein A2X56_10205 [Nitrospirae bacterium GWC2_57_13]
MRNVPGNSAVVACLLVIMLGVTAAADTIGGGDIIFTPKNAKEVIFSHEKHVHDKGLKCTGCHYQIFQMTKGSYKMQMSKITKGDFCGKCHNGIKAFDATDEQHCARCHK